MTKPLSVDHAKAVDGIQDRLTSYACSFGFDALIPEVLHAAKVRVIDTLGVLIGGFFAEPSRISRELASEMPMAKGATIIGSRMKTTPDMAAFVNGTTARYLELTDSYHFPGSYGGHPSNVLTPVFSVAEYVQASGRDFIANLVLAYETFLRMNDVFDNMGFDPTIFCTLGTAIGSGKLLGLSREQLSHCISIAIVPNNALRVTRMGNFSMWKGAATGQAGRAGVFAAQLASKGMEGPHLPFEAPSGWCNHVALKKFSLDAMGGNGTPFKILNTTIKTRPCVGLGISPVLAAEKIAPLRSFRDVKEIIVEVHKRTKINTGTGAHYWNPASKETADHSTPYLVATTLMDGTITTGSYTDAQIANPEKRALMQKIKVVENEAFTAAYNKLPVEQRARITVISEGAEPVVSETIGGADELEAPKSDAQIEDKFRRLTEDYLGATRVNRILERLWRLDEVENVTSLLPDFVLD